ncbi:VOC family protein [Enterococcus sp. BWM-S5]|uniref:VOC family protein n=1 Tax=Enterococcus larvae TaxID=2794352 RepID=A0ABS4CNJ4_9ENTE|nr:VOC family protein [Enterococcus larvae]MBP1047768.1 VOC family protein [Enterococcus larvae]
MKFGGTLLIVEDIEKSKEFYQDQLGLKVTMDLGEHVSFENGLALQVGYEKIIGQHLKKIQGAHNFQIYFEVDNICEWEQRMNEAESVVFLHSIREYPWGQRSIRIYDVDKNILEIAESMDSVIKNCIAQGMIVEDIAKKTMYPIEYIETLL